MEIKILQVFYGKDGLPYKDKERQVHFPILGTGFLGASNTTKIKFYYDELDDTNQTTWVAVSKLPNGRVGSRVLESYLDDELNEHYALLELDNYYTQYKGDVFISLQGYQGGVNVDYDEENSQYEIHGTPTIAATGSIKFTINYANQFVGSGETDNINFQRVLAALGTKLGMRAYSEHVEELPSEGNPNVFYVINDDPNNPNLANIYVWNENTQHYIWVGDNSLYLGNYYPKASGERLEQELEDTNDRIDELGAAYIFKGSKTVAQINALTGMTAGDAYNVTDSGTITTGSVVVSAGDNVAWNGTAWDKLSNSIDLSGYATKEYVAQAFVNASYDNETKDIIFTLRSGSTLAVPLDDITTSLLATIQADYLSKSDAQTNYQKKLTAGTNIYIDQTTGVISASGNTVIKIDEETGLPYATESDLPTASASTTGAIYLVASASPTTENQCAEYITIHNESTDTYSWECIGTTAVDLTNYCTLNTEQTFTASKSLASGCNIKFKDANNDVVSTIDNEKVTYNDSGTNKSFTWAQVFNAVNNALINGSGTATTVAIGNTLGYPNIAESVLIGVQASAGSSSRTREVTVGYKASGGTDGVAIGNNAKITNGTKSVVIGSTSSLSDIANDGKNVLVGYGINVSRGTSHTMIGAGTQTTPASESDSSKYADNDVVLGSDSANTLKNNVSFDGPSRNRTIWLLDPTKILFRNENVDMSKRTESSYTSMKTLNDYLFGTGVDVTSTNAGVTVAYDHIVLGYDGIVRGVLKIAVGNSNITSNTVIGTISEAPTTDIFIVGSDGDSVFVQFKIDTSGNITSVDSLLANNTYCLNIVY